MHTIISLIMLHYINNFINYAALCGLAVTLIFVGKVIYNLCLHPLRKYPGPRMWAATRLAWTYAMQSGRYHRMLRGLHDRYGPVVRIAPNELSFTHPQAWKDIYGNRNITKNRIWAGQEEEHHPVSIVSTDEATHLKNRRALTGAFTEHAIVEHASILEDLTRLMVEKFKNLAESDKGRAVVNMTDWFNFLTFDISGVLSFGESFNSVKNGCAHPWVDISCNFGKGIGLMASINFYRPLNKLLKLAIPKKVLEQMQYHRQLVHELFGQRLVMENKNKAQDYVGSIMEYNKDKGEIKIPNDEIELNMTILIFAGSETSSSAMTATLTQLLQNSTALKQAQNEVRTAFTDEKDITVANVAHLIHLTAVIQEGIRMAPAAPIGPPRVTPKGGAQILGQQVPGNTFVSVNQYPTFRSASNFTQPDAFIPERFLANSPFPDDRLDAFEPFLVGRHRCIGQKLAWSIMRLTLARLLYTFDMKAVGNPGDFGDQKTYLFWEKKPLQVELQLRDPR